MRSMNENAMTETRGDTGWKLDANMRPLRKAYETTAAVISCIANEIVVST